MRLSREAILAEIQTTNIEFRELTRCINHICDTDYDYPGRNDLLTRHMADRDRLSKRLEELRGMLT